MELEDQRLDEEQIRRLSTVELVRRALEEARLLTRAEILHAKQEMREELRAAKGASALLGACLALALSGLAIALSAIAFALPITGWLAALIVGLGLIVIAGGLGFVGLRRLPKKPLPHTQERLRTDVSLAREQLQ